MDDFNELLDGELEQDEETEDLWEEPQDGGDFFVNKPRSNDGDSFFPFAQNDKVKMWESERRSLNNDRDTTDQKSKVSLPPKFESDSFGMPPRRPPGSAPKFQVDNMWGGIGNFSNNSSFDPSNDTQDEEDDLIFQKLTSEAFANLIGSDEEEEDDQRDTRRPQSNYMSGASWGNDTWWNGSSNNASRQVKAPPISNSSSRYHGGPPVSQRPISNDDSQFEDDDSDELHGELDAPLSPPPGFQKKQQKAMNQPPRQSGGLPPHMSSSQQPNSHTSGPTSNQAQPPGLNMHPPPSQASIPPLNQLLSKAELDYLSAQPSHIQIAYMQQLSAKWYQQQQQQYLYQQQQLQQYHALMQLQKQQHQQHQQQDQKSSEENDKHHHHHHHDQNQSGMMGGNNNKASPHHHKSYHRTGQPQYRVKSQSTSSSSKDADGTSSGGGSGSSGSGGSSSGGGGNEAAFSSVDENLMQQQKLQQLHQLLQQQRQQQQQHQQQQQNTESEGSNTSTTTSATSSFSENNTHHQKNKRPVWKEDKSLMLAKDIEIIIKIQENQLYSDNPFLEDYYFQNYMKKKSPKQIDPEILYRHRPICECLKPAGTVKKRTFVGGKDPLEGVLGRVPSLSVRAPRPLVELDDDDESEDQKRNVEDTSIPKVLPVTAQSSTPTSELTGSNEDLDDVDVTPGVLSSTSNPSNSTTSTTSTTNKKRAFVTKTDGLSSLPRTVLLTIETAMAAVLEIEDLDLILNYLGTEAAKEDTCFNRNNIVVKRQERMDILFGTFNINKNSISAPSPSNIDGYYSVEDEFFVRILSINKGAKLMCRSLPLLHPYSQVVPVVYVILRNLHVIVHFPTNEEEDERLKSVFAVVLSALNNHFTFPQFLSCFQALVLANHVIIEPPSSSRSESQVVITPLIKRRMIRTVKTKIGIAVFSMFLQKGNESSTHLTKQLQQLRATQQQMQLHPQYDEAAVNEHINSAMQLIHSWQHLFNIFYHEMIGKLSSLFTTSLTSNYTNGCPSEHIWEFFILLSNCANPQQKKEILAELSPIINTVESTQTISWLVRVLTNTQTPSS
eukprot:TRINITY_DN305_c5_g1_i1.p1 TRINITY_DN305_c5_g1~~TRINITY_DN305_c5_g1_i1.p1  ORF type:complete len:1060 (-),score=361.55 TRINITY_DN305_c5_g1_i1:53-3232(-)